MGNTAVDANFPKRELPLSLDDSVTNINFEGQPDHIYADRLEAQSTAEHRPAHLLRRRRSTAVRRVRSERAPRPRAAQEQLHDLSYRPQVAAPDLPDLRVHVREWFADCEAAVRDLV